MFMQFTKACVDINLLSVALTVKVMTKSQEKRFRNIEEKHHPSGFPTKEPVIPSFDDCVCHYINNRYTQPVLL